MEKFGIFELLDALSALLPANGGDPLSPQENAADDTANQTQTKAAPEPARRAEPDAAFAPPDYGTGMPAPQESGEHSALDTLLRRHEQLSRKIKTDK